MSPELFREAGTDPPCEQEFVFVVVPDEQSTKILAAASGSVYPPITNSCCCVSLILSQAELRRPDS